MLILLNDNGFGYAADGGIIRKSEIKVKSMLDEDCDTFVISVDKPAKEGMATALKLTLDDGYVINLPVTSISKLTSGSCGVRCIRFHDGATKIVSVMVTEVPDDDGDIEEDEA